MPALDRKWWTLIAVCTATFMLLLDITVVNVALPDIQQSLHSSLQRPPVGGRRLLPHPGRLPAHRRRGRRHVRPPGGVRRRAGGVLGRLAHLRAVHVVADAQPVPGRPGRRRGHHVRHLPGPHRRGLHRPGAGHGLRDLRRRAGRSGGRRTADRWGHHQRHRLAVDLLRQRAHRGRWPSCITLAKIQESKDPNHRRVDWIGFVSFSAALFLLVFALIRGNDDGWGSTLIVGLLVGVGRPADRVPGRRVARAGPHAGPDPVQAAGHGAACP